MPSRRSPCMQGLEDAARSAKITAPEPRVLPSLEITAASEIPRALAPMSLDDLNELHREMDFPVIETRMLSDHAALIDVLNNLNIEYARYGLEFAPELPEIRRRQEEISLRDEHERECDVLEVELANIRQGYDKIQEYDRCSINDLKHRVDELRRMFNDMEYEKSHPDIIGRVLGFLRGDGEADEDVIGCLGYVKETKEYLNTIDKMLCIEEIDRMPDSHEKSVCKCLVLEESIELDRLQHNLGIDRTALLRIVYGLLSKGIVGFDRSGDRVSLQR